MNAPTAGRVTPPAVVTVTGCLPVGGVGGAGTVATTWVSVEDVTVAAYPPMVTVAPASPVPSMVTELPGTPDAGEVEVRCAG